MRKADADLWAKDNGYETTDEVTLRSGEVVYLLQSEDGAVIGLPRFIRWTEIGFIESSDEESMALFREPDYMRDDDDA